jgi:hypothetical protein
MAQALELAQARDLVLCLAPLARDLLLCRAHLALELLLGRARLVMSHYNLRITRAREDARKLVDQMKKKYDIDYDNITDKHVALDYVGPTRDEGELQMFKGALIMSSLLPLLVALFRTLAS